MAEDFSWTANSGSAPLPALKRPPIRPVGVRTISGFTLFVIAATLLHAISMGFGLWVFEGFRRDLALNRDDGLWDEAWVEPWLKTGGLGPGEGDPEDEAEVFRRSEYHRGMRLLEHGSLRIAFFWSALVTHALELAAFILWQVRAHSNLSGLGSVGLRFGSKSSVVWWFVPIAVLWKPVGVVQEIWKGSDPSVAAGDELGWRLKRSSFLAAIWWSLLVGAKCLFWFSVLMGLGNLFTIVSPLEMFLVALSTMIAADALQVALVRRVGLRQAALERKRLAAVAKAEGAGEQVVDVDELLIRVKRRPDETSFAGEIALKEPALSETETREPKVADEPALLLTDEEAVDDYETEQEPKPSDDAPESKA